MGKQDHPFADSGFTKPSFFQTLVLRTANWCESGLWLNELLSDRGLAKPAFSKSWFYAWRVVVADSGFSEFLFCENVFWQNSDLMHGNLAMPNCPRDRQSRSQTGFFQTVVLCMASCCNRDSGKSVFCETVV